MAATPAPAPRVLVILLAGLLAPAPVPGQGPSYPASVEAWLKPDELALRLGIGRGAGPGPFLRLGLDADEGGRELGGCLSLGSGQGARLVAGQGSAAGATRLLIDPSSPTALSDRDPVEIDPSLESRTQVLALSAGQLSLFALRPGGAEAQAAEEAAAGISFGLPGPEGGLRAIGAAYYEGRPAQISGWRPDSAASPLSRAADRGEPCFSAALIADQRRLGASSLAAFAGSWGRVSGPGFALRLEAQELLGPLRLRLAAGAAGPAFRELLGPRSSRRLCALAEARLAMRRASVLSASMQAEALGESLLYAPLWRRKAALDLLLPLAGGAGRIETGLAGEAQPEGGSTGSFSLALLRRAEGKASAGPGWASGDKGSGGSGHGSGSPGSGSPGSGGRSYSSSSRLGATLAWDGGISGLALGLKTELARAGGPALGLDISLDLFDGGSADAPVIARGALSLELPFGPGASLELSAALPEKGRVLCPSPDAPEGPVLGLRYRASFSVLPSRSRPRSRISAWPKARSIAQRAES